MENNLKIENFIDLDFLNLKPSDIEYIPSKGTNIDKLKDIFDDISSSDIIGMDSEWARYDSPIKCLLFQIATRKKAYVFDFLGEKELDNFGVIRQWTSNDDFDKNLCFNLNNIFLDPKVLKVAWDFDLDLKNLNNRFANSLHTVNNFIDLMPIHPKDLEKGFSSSCNHFMGRKLDKTNQNADWGVRPLGEDMITYAALDALVSISLYDKMKEKKLLNSMSSKILTLKDVHKRMQQYKQKHQGEWNIARSNIGTQGEWKIARPNIVKAEWKIAEPGSGDEGWNIGTFTKPDIEETIINELINDFKVKNSNI
jgi:ribonuclease D